jgi:hypothetical protein
VEGRFNFLGVGVGVFISLGLDACGELGLSFWTDEAVARA